MKKNEQSTVINININIVKLVKLYLSHNDNIRAGCKSREFQNCAIVERFRYKLKRISTYNKIWFRLSFLPQSSFTASFNAYPLPSVIHIN